MKDLGDYVPSVDFWESGVSGDFSKGLQHVDEEVNHAFRDHMWLGILLSSADKSLLLHEGFSWYLTSTSPGFRCLQQSRDLAQGNSHSAFFLPACLCSKVCLRDYWLERWPTVIPNSCVALCTFHNELMNIHLPNPHNSWEMNYWRMRKTGNIEPISP